MAPMAKSLAQSEPKKRFFERLGLSDGNKLHRRLYSNMKTEAVEGWNRLSADRNGLAAHLRGDPSVEAPYAYKHIDEDVLNREVARIYHRARSDTKMIYALGQDSDDETSDNWIIRWLLWHVFRYRDGRNVHSSHRCRMRRSGELDSHSDASPEPQHTEPDMDLDDQTEEREHTCVEPALSRTQSNPETTQAIRASRYFDPVRDLYRTCPT
ncbi:hypothetical protein CB0940_05299 [Cercospora beticola]|uniref:Uncharacterized protein n=1 Tax=Cercospora beticola TaxID=122368 RepID=A0A2G5I0C7_CERBT|nr:hypothetical protein CB0940_05299 [Cercospora beticola]PIA98211.1 hypothetical protein CB0940_05299 [Cercospora beticola]WPA97834.1 hypothetical protein RHO25_002445 [Cercospora beticola]CAK1359031.1 unnamed protein product [Cercospora beticola]